MGLLEGFLWGLAGGALAELLGWFKLRHQAPEQLPVWMGTIYYWGMYRLDDRRWWSLGIAYLRSEIKLNPITAINIGASAPLLLGSFISQIPSIPIGRVD